MKVGQMIKEACLFRTIILAVLYFHPPLYPLGIDLTCVLGCHQADLHQEQKAQGQNSRLLQIISPPPSC